MAGVLLLIPLLAAACGTRVSGDAESGAAPAPAAYGTGSVPTDQGDSVSAPAETSAPAGGSGATGTALSDGAPGSDVSAGARAGASGTSSAPAGARAPAVGSPSAGGGAAGQGASNSPAPRSDASPVGGAPVPTVATVPVKRTPVLVANVGTYSGPAAATLKPNVDGVQLWVKSVNQRGGLNGHEVRILVYDDAGDPARHKAQVQEAVEQKKVLAFVGNAEALTGPSSSDYLAAKRIPVVGVDGGWDFPYQNPMYFLQVSSGTAFVTTFILSTAQLACRRGKRSSASWPAPKPRPAPTPTRSSRPGPKGLASTSSTGAGPRSPSRTSPSSAWRPATPESRRSSS